MEEDPNHHGALPPDQGGIAGSQEVGGDNDGDDGSDDDFQSRAWKAFRTTAVAGALTPLQFQRFAELLHMDMRLKHVEAMFAGEKKKTVNFATAMRLVESGAFQDDVKEDVNEEDGGTEQKEERVGLITYLQHITGISPAPADVHYVLGLPTIPPLQIVTISASIIFAVMVTVIFVLLATIWSQAVNDSIVDSVRRNHEAAQTMDERFAFQTQRVKLADRLDTVDTLRQWVAKDIDLTSKDHMATDNLMLTVTRRLAVRIRDKTIAIQTDKWRNKLMLLGGAIASASMPKQPLTVLQATALLNAWESRYRVVGVITENTAPFRILAASPSLNSATNRAFLENHFCVQDVRNGTAAPRSAGVEMFPNAVALRLNTRFNATLLRFYMDVPYECSICIGLLDKVIDRTWITDTITVLDAYNQDTAASSQQLLSTRYAELFVVGLNDDADAPPSTISFPSYTNVLQMQTQSRLLTRPLQDTSHCVFSRCTVFSEFFSRILRRVKQSGAEGPYTLINQTTSDVFAYDDQVASIQFTVVKGRFMPVVIGSIRYALLEQRYADDKVAAITEAVVRNLPASVFLSAWNDPGTHIFSRTASAGFSAALPCFYKNCSLLPYQEGEIAAAFNQGAISMIRTNASFLPTVLAVGSIEGTKTLFTLRTPRSETSDSAQQMLAATLQRTATEGTEGPAVEAYAIAGRPTVPTFDPREPCPAGLACVVRSDGTVAFREDCDACIPYVPTTITSMDNLTALTTRANRSKPYGALLNAIALEAAKTGNSLVRSVAYGGDTVVVAASTCAATKTVIVTSVSISAKQQELNTTLGTAVGSSLVVIVACFIGVILFARHTANKLDHEANIQQEKYSSHRSKLDAMLKQAIPASLVDHSHKVAHGHVVQDAAFVCIDACAFAQVVRQNSKRAAATASYLHHVLNTAATWFNVFRVKYYGDTAVFANGLIDSKNAASSGQGHDDTLASAAVRPQTPAISESAGGVSATPQTKSGGGAAGDANNERPTDAHTIAAVAAEFACTVAMLFSPIYDHFPGRMGYPIARDERAGPAEAENDVATAVPMPVLRVGVHAGPCVASIRNINSVPIFDVFGPSLQVAHRLQATGAAGTVTVSVTVKELIETVDARSLFDFDVMKRVVIKGRGSIGAFSVRSIGLPLDDGLLSRCHIERSERKELFAAAAGFMNSDAAAGGTTAGKEGQQGSKTRSSRNSSLRSDEHTDTE